MSVDHYTSYFDALKNISSRIEVTNGSGEIEELSQAMNRTMGDMRKCHADNKRIIFVGNGGSAGITSHMATDYAKNGQLRTLVFSDPAMLTCLSNDLGYENVFAYPVELHGVSGDILIAISSSGQSKNILNAVTAAKKIGMSVLTLSGFDSDNPLRAMGDLNLYVPSREYGFVEITHLVLLHALLDTHMGWSPSS